MYMGICSYKNNINLPVTDDLIGRKYVPPKLPALSTSFGVMFGWKSFQSSNTSCPFLFFVGSLAVNSISEAS